MSPGPPPPPRGPYHPAWYISRRSIEAPALRALEQPGCALVILGPPLSGKKWLLSHLEQIVCMEDRQRGQETVVLDLNLSDLERTAFDHFESLVEWIIQRLSEQLPESIFPEEAPEECPAEPLEPLQPGSRRFRELRSRLTELVPDVDMARLIAQDAGLPAESINFQDSSLLAWQRILEITVGQGRTATLNLLNDLMQRYPGDSLLVNEARLAARPERPLDADVPPLNASIRLRKFMLKILEASPGRVLLVFRGVNYVQETPASPDFFRMLRSWTDNLRPEPWLRLRLVCLTSRRSGTGEMVASDFYNRAVVVKLEPLASDEILRLVEMHSVQWTPEEVLRLEAMVGGHPFLLRAVLCRTLDGIPAEELLELEYLEQELFLNHLNERSLWMEQEGLLNHLCRAIHAPLELLPDDAYFRLFDAYIIATRNGDFRCQLYAEAFRKRCQCPP